MYVVVQENELSVPAISIRANASHASYCVTGCGQVQQAIRDMRVGEVREFAYKAYDVVGYSVYRVAATDPVAALQEIRTL